MRGGSIPHAPSPPGLDALHQFACRHRKIVENFSTCVHLLLRVAQQMPLKSHALTTEYGRDVFFLS
jgi:hypothetical protein